MKIEVPNGEIVDKLTILSIKQDKILDPEKLFNIQQEIKAIESISQSILPKNSELFHQLTELNLKLWNIEDALRHKEKLQEFDQEFIELARQVYKTNDERASVKKKINQLSESRLFEEKSYEQY